MLKVHNMQQEYVHKTPLFAPETHASENGICLTTQMCRKMILFQKDSMIKKDESYQNVKVFCHGLKNIGFPMKGMLIG